MKLKILLVIAVSAVVVITSCKKDETLPEQYMRGGNNLLLDGNNLIIAGYNTATSNGYDATLIKTDMNGNILMDGGIPWVKTYGSTYADAFFNVKKAHNEGYIAVGFSNQSNSNSPYTFVVITDASGTVVKSKTYGTKGYCQGFSVLPVESPDSGYMVAGYVVRGGLDRDIQLIHIEDDGDTLWQKSYGARGTSIDTPTNDAAYSIIAAPGGGYYVTGSINGYNSCCGNIFLMKVSAKGDSLWTTMYSKGIGYSLILDSDGKIVIGGTNQESADNNMTIIKTELDGTLIGTEHTYGGTRHEYGASLIQTTNGYAMTGLTASSGAGYDDVVLLKTDKSLVSEPLKTYGGTNVDQGFGLVQYEEDFFICGLSNTGGSYIFMNRIENNGTERWIRKFGSGSVISNTWEQ